MRKQITVQQLIEKLKVLDPNYTFDIEYQPYFPDDNNDENCKWVHGVYLDKELFGTLKKGKGYFLEEDFNKVFVPKDKYL